MIHDRLKRAPGTIISALIRPHKLFGQLQGCLDYGDGDILLMVSLAPIVFIGTWGFSMLAGLNSLSLAVHTSVIVGIAAGILVGWMLFGRVWAWYVTWAIRKFMAIKIDKRSAYQIFSISMIPNLLFPMMMLFGWLIPIWILMLQWMGLINGLKVSWGKAMVIVLIPIPLTHLISIGYIFLAGYLF